MIQRIFNGGSPLRRDIVVAGAALMIVLGATFLATESGWYPSYLGDFVLVAVLSAIVWPASRVYPASTLLICAVIVAMPLWFFPAHELRLIPLMLAAFRAALHGAPRGLVFATTMVAGFCGVANTALYTAISAYSSGASMWFAYPYWEFIDPSRSILTGVVLVVSIVLGYTLHSQRAVARDLLARNAELQELRDADRARVETEVRTAVARDIHDIVAHHVSAMVIRAQAAERVSAGDAAALRETVHAIAADGSAALTGVRHAVRMLRGAPGGLGGEEQSSIGLLDVDDELQQMLDRVRASGREVNVRGALREGPEFARVAVMRIVQESLTNVMLHSSASRVDVVFETTASELIVSICDDGPHADASVTSPGGGNGIPGMKDRAAALGGRVAAGVEPDGGWMVRATFPHLDARSARA